MTDYYTPEAFISLVRLSGVRHALLQYPRRLRDAARGMQKLSSEDWQRYRTPVLSILTITFPLPKKYAWALKGNSLFVSYSAHLKKLGSSSAHIIDDFFFPHPAQQPSTKDA